MSLVEASSRMRRTVAFLAVAASIAIFPSSALSLSNAEIKQKMINESIQGYSGSCPCPFNRARNGSKCGGRSAWSRAGGAAPLCYESDITDTMLERYIRRNGIKKN